MPLCSCRLSGDAPQTAGVHLAHVRKAHAETLVIRADERIGSKQVDVIVDDHQGTLREAGIDSAGRIREDDLLDAKAPHDTRRKNDRRQVVAFVEMCPA